MKTSYPKCTHCGYELDDEELWMGEYTVGGISKEDGELSEVSCPNLDCGKKFKTMCFNVIGFVQVDEDGDEI